MHKHILLLIACLSIFAFSQSATEDQVHFPIPGYNDHKWFSGNFLFTQDILILIWANFITFISNLKEILKMILYCCGLMEDQDVVAL